MLHVLTSIGFSFVALAALSFTALMLVASRDAIMGALGLRHADISRAPRHPVRIRTAGRWQTVPTTAAVPQRRAA
jgi:hypothetical protein